MYRILVLALLLQACGLKKTAPDKTVAPELESNSQSRIRALNRPVKLNRRNLPRTDPVYEGPLTGGAPIEFEFVAQILPPYLSNNGHFVQATSVRKIQNSETETDTAPANNRVIVTYNTAGDEVAGGFDVLDFTAADAPVLTNSFAANGYEFSDAVARDHIVYAVGNTSDEAVLMVFDLNQRPKPNLLRTVSLPGQTATSVQVQANQLMVTTANNGGVMGFDLEQADDPRILFFDALDGATYAYFFKNNWIVGAHLHNASPLQLFDGILKPLLSVPFEWSTTPARLSSVQNTILTNASPGYMTAFDSEKFPLQLNISEKFSLPGQGNGLDARHSFSLLAQGDAGLIWADHSGIALPQPNFGAFPKGARWPEPDERQTKLLGFFDFENDNGTANQVLILGNTILIADGEGGLRWLRTKARTMLRSSFDFVSKTSYKDEIHFLSASSIRIPTEIQVIHGNAWNKFATLELDDLVCYYQGRANTKNPPRLDGIFWPLGTSYKLKMCANGKRAGESVTVQRRIRMEIQGGHPVYSPVTAEVSLEPSP